MRQGPFSLPEVFLFAFLHLFVFQSVASYRTLAFPTEDAHCPFYVLRVLFERRRSRCAASTFTTVLHNQPGSPYKKTSPRERIC